MFEIERDSSIHVTRGDIGVIEFSGKNKNDDSPYKFKSGDKVRLQVYEKKNPEKVVLRKVVNVGTETESVDIPLTKDDTKIGNLISAPVEYWYEIELNPDTAPQTFIGYDKKQGPKKFMLYPEGADA